MKENQSPTATNQSQESDVQTNSDSVNSGSNILWLVGCAIVTFVAIVYRFWQLELKPLHHDEGVNGYFLKALFNEGVYKYDPTNYHGPTLYYISLAFTKLFGLETFAVRASVAVFGVALVLMTFFLRRYIGAIGSLAAALLLALSPGMVYISRYFIHEIFFVFCSFGIVLGVVFFIENRRAGIFASGWTALLLLVCFLPPALNVSSLISDDPSIVTIARIALFAVFAALTFFIVRMLLDWNAGRPIYLILASASASLFFATKETAFITVGTMLIACACVWLWRKILPPKNEGVSNEFLSEPAALSWSNFRRNLGEGRELSLVILAALFIFAFVSVLFFSSFFTYPEGVLKAFEAYAVWTRTGTKDHTQNGFLGYAKWLWRIESPIVFLAAVGSLIALFKGRHRFAIFTAFWWFGLFAAYSIIPYKTPWLALSFILPMCLVAGYGINELATSRDALQKILAGVFMFVAVAVVGYQSYDLNFVRYDDDTKPYVYAHTKRGFLDLVERIEHYAQKSGKGRDATIEIVSPDYWGMPWYTRFYTAANYHSKIVPVNAAEMIVAKKGDQDDAIMREYSSRYKYVGTYPLRPGVDLYLLVRRDLADSGAKEIYQIEGLKLTENPATEDEPEEK